VITGTATAATAVTAAAMAKTTGVEGMETPEVVVWMMVVAAGIWGEEIFRRGGRRTTKKRERSEGSPDLPVLDGTTSWRRSQARNQRSQMFQREWIKSISL